VAGDSFETGVVRVAIPAIATTLIWVLAGALSLSIGPEQRAEALESAVPVAEDVDVASYSDVMDRKISAVSSSAQRIRTCGLPADLVDLENGELTAAVTDSTGELMWSRLADQPVAPASVQKILTATAAWRVLGPDFRFVTSVKADSSGNLWLVGGGDPTLTRAPGNNYYDSESSLADLAERTVIGVSKRGLPAPHTLHVDTSRYESFREWDESWRPGSWALGYVAPVTSLMVDGDRDSPVLRLGARSTNPTSRAQVWFSEALAQRGMIFSAFAPASPAQGIEVARVDSAPLPELLRIMLEDSDNSLAEALAREVALASGTTDLNEALVHALGVSEAEQVVLFLRDGSGLSPLNQLPASLVVRVLGEWVTTPELAPLLDSLAIAGETGSLQRRFGGDSSVRGIVKAKTGSIAGVRSLAGVFEDDNGNSLIFSLNISGPQVSDRDRESLDALTEAIYDCGENLAHWEGQDVSTTE
jgi:D-alanyl-D-alanine carboxypeptidase/D-alanyl-D-alanine-endopeptidase (penicillin-binding protein 4)